MSQVTTERWMPEQPAVSAPTREPERVTSLRDLAKFTGLVGLFAIFSDAALGHALLWENDPYWTYWVTKTFLILTVFGLGTAWLGLGLARGAMITAVHTLVLTAYYWTFSPVGLPSQPQWLDLEHTWVTGLPVHFTVIYVGYVASLWLWQRRSMPQALERRRDSAGVARDAGRALVIALGIVLVGGGLSSLALGDFPGVTWFLVRLLIAVPFLLAWWGLAGRDRIAAVFGGVTLALVFATYGHFVGPVGLPDFPLRIADQAPPEATVSWLSYREEWLISLPILLLVSVLAMLIAARGEEVAPASDRLRWVGAALSAGVILIALGLGAAAFTKNDESGDPASLQASGSAAIERGDWYSGGFGRADAALQLRAYERNPRVTPLPPHDAVELVATVEHPDGTRYEIRADEPMVEDALGRHTTSGGVALHGWHHGASGIGTSKLPAVHSEVAVSAVGDVFANGRRVASGVPVHVMTTTKALPLVPGRLELAVGDESSPVPALRHGHLRVVWEDFSGGAGQGPKRARNALGSGLLLGLAALGIVAVRREQVNP